MVNAYLQAVTTKSSSYLLFLVAAQEIPLHSFGCHEAFQALHSTCAYLCLQQSLQHLLPVKHEHTGPFEINSIGIESSMLELWLLAKLC